MTYPLFNKSIPASACSAETFLLPPLFGAEYLSIEANLVSNYTENVPFVDYINHGDVNVTNAQFCNASLWYRHPGLNDTINVQVWLPSNTWNGRLQALGGQGWQAGCSESGMGAAVGEGYAALTTDAGLGNSFQADPWALLSPGNVNQYLLQDLGYASLNDAAIIGKEIINCYYGQPPVYSYWSGCSQGGRQGLTLAQRYPDAFDGIAAASPAIHWNQFLVADFWSNILMNEMNEYPHPCEINAITEAAIEACDGNDGLVDGFLSNLEPCDFDAATLVGKNIYCNDTGEDLQISPAAAIVTQGVWDGPTKSDNSSLWFGFTKDTILPSLYIGVAFTTCLVNGTCMATPLGLSEEWIRLFILKDSDAVVSQLTREDYERIFRISVQEYSSVIGSNDPDLSAFRDRGGKIVTYHGLADGIITPYSSKYYYDAVTALDKNVHDYFRLFFAPGLGHCIEGNGVYPAGAFDSLRTWVETGVAPNNLSATGLNDVASLKRTLCPYPKRGYYTGVGNSTIGEGFICM